MLPTFNLLETVAVAGGLAFALFLVGTFTVGLCSKFALELFLVQDLYRAQREQQESGDEIEKVAVNSVEGRERIQVDKAYFLNLCCLRKKNYHADLVSNGRLQLSKELEVTRLLKNSKYSKSAIESILTPAQLKMNKLQKRVTAVKDIKLNAVPSSSSDEGKIEDLVKQCQMSNQTDCHLLLGLANTKVTEAMFNNTMQ